MDGAKFEIKPKKGDHFSIKLTKAKQKLSLICTVLSHRHLVRIGDPDANATASVTGFVYILPG